MKVKSQSLGVIKLQKEIYNQLSEKKQNQFVPFINQRKLGKLINQNIKYAGNNQKPRVEQITFKNFKKIYNRERIVQNARYSRMTRNSDQQDLISFRNDWKVNKVSSQLNFNKSQSLMHSRQCCLKSKFEPKKSVQKFDKIDEDVYKKIVVSKPAQHLKNPEINTFFQHYVQACELNQNIRRLELTRKRKY